MMEFLLWVVIGSVLLLAGVFDLGGLILWILAPALLFAVLFLFIVAVAYIMDALEMR